MVGISGVVDVTVKEQVAVLPEPSVTVSYSSRPRKLDPLAKPAVCVRFAPAQLSLKLTE
ncbi:MAG: hypothetical protein IPP17_10295 [Bacteroidetes bacterium]|nr:hypothetical protein [Bacteroidota bacterium]